MSTPLRADALRSIIDTSNLIANLFDDFYTPPEFLTPSASPATTIESASTPTPSTPPDLVKASSLALPTIRTFKLPSNKSKITPEALKKLRGIFREKINHLRQVAVDEYHRLGQSLDDKTLSEVAVRLREGFVTSGKALSKSASEAIAEAYDIATVDEASRSSLRRLLVCSDIKNIFLSRNRRLKSRLIR